MRERDGVVTVGCRAATWAQELDLLQDELLERLNRALEPRRVAAASLQSSATSSAAELTLVHDLQVFCLDSAAFPGAATGILM